MSFLNQIGFCVMMALMMLLTSCSSIRMAVYDFQKKQAYSSDSHMTTPVAEKKVYAAEKLAITEKASKYIGTRYRYGSCDPGKGFDCSGLVYHVAKSNEIELPRSSSSMASVGAHIPWKKAEPGDIIFFGDNGRIHHVGIVEKNKGDEIWIIHSSSSNGVLREDIMESDYWKRRVLFAIDITSLKTSRT